MTPMAGHCRAGWNPEFFAALHHGSWRKKIAHANFLLDFLPKID